MRIRPATVNGKRGWCQLCNLSPINRGFEFRFRPLEDDGFHAFHYQKAVRQWVSNWRNGVVKLFTAYSLFICFHAVAQDAATQNAIALQKDQNRRVFNSFFYSKFDPETDTIALNNNKNFFVLERTSIEDGLGISVSAVVSNVQTAPIVKTVKFDIYFDRSGSKDDADSFDITCDDKKKSFPELKWKKLLDTLGTMTVELPYKDFRALAFAKSAEGELGNDSFDMPYDSRASLRAFIIYFEGFKNAQTTP